MLFNSDGEYIKKFAVDGGLLVISSKVFSFWVETYAGKKISLAEWKSQNNIDDVRYRSLFEFAKSENAKSLDRAFIKNDVCYHLDDTFSLELWRNWKSDLNAAIDAGYKPLDRFRIDPSKVESFVLDRGCQNV